MKKRKKSSREDLVAAFLEVKQRAKTHREKIALVGGLAMDHYGSDRLTYDVDVLTESPESLLPELSSSLSFGGFRGVASNGVEVDLIKRDDEQADLYAEALETAQGDVVSPEHLAAIKFLAGRKKDLLDLDFLIQENICDVEVVGKILRRHAGWYAQADFAAYVAEALWRKSIER